MAVNSNVISSNVISSKSVTYIVLSITVILWLEKIKQPLQDKPSPSVHPHVIRPTTTQRQPD